MKEADAVEASMVCAPSFGGTKASKSNVDFEVIGGSRAKNWPTTLDGNLFKQRVTSDHVGSADRLKHLQICDMVAAGNAEFEIDALTHGPARNGFAFSLANHLGRQYSSGKKVSDHL